MNARFDLAMADHFGLAGRIGHQPTPKDLDHFGPIRPWNVMRADGTLSHVELARPTGARSAWCWLCNVDPWASEEGFADLVVAIAASSSHASRCLFLIETDNPAAFFAWKHAIMREGRQALVDYWSSPQFVRSSEARAALSPPMSDPAPPTPEVRRLYDRAKAFADQIGFKVSNDRFFAPWIGECHWQKWPIQHVLIAGVEGGWWR